VLIRTSREVPQFPCRISPSDRAGACGFYLAIARSCTLLPLASPSNMRQRPKFHEEGPRDSLVSASAATISAQTDCRLVPCLFPALQLRDQASEVPLRVDGRSARRRMCHSPRDFVGNNALNQRAHGRRVLTLAYLEQHVACVSVCRTRCHLRRNTRPSAGQSSARCAP